METNKSDSQKNPCNSDTVSKGINFLVEKFRGWIAILLVLSYVVYIFYISLCDDWDNKLYLLKGLEILVFTALGYIFGKEISRGQVKGVKESAEIAKKEAQENKKIAQEAANTINAKAVQNKQLIKKVYAEKLKGISLAAMAKAKNQEDYNLFRSNPKTDNHIYEGRINIASLAEKYYPELQTFNFDEFDVENK